jgi:RNA polymerase sigma-70 factor (ECF subfamily)
VVLAAGRESSPGAQDALDQLCRAYWRPLYAYVRRQGRGVEESKDLTQAFFARFIERHYFGRASPEVGRFRSFLLTSLKHFLVNDWEHERADRRGGDRTFLSLEALAEAHAGVPEPVDAATPEISYERHWASTLLQSALSRIETEYASAGKSDLFHALKGRLWGTEPSESYAQLARRMGQTEGAVKTAAHRVRRRYRDVLREEVAHTVAHRGDVEDELRHLIAVLSQPT